MKRPAMIHFDARMADEKEYYSLALVTWRDHAPGMVLKDADEVIDPSEEIRVEFSYPLADKHTFRYKRPGGWTRRAFVDQVVQQYVEIYAAEEQSSGKTGNIPGMMNRARSKGLYGIWGHHLHDLFLEGAYKQDGVWRLGIGS